MESTMSRQQGRRRPRRIDAIENEARVRQAAEVVLRRLGGAMTMDDVAAEAGVSKGTVYSTFGSRNQLLEEMAILFFDRAHDSYVEALQAPSAWDALAELFLEPTIQLTSAARDAMNPDRPDDAVKKAGRRTFDALDALIEKGKREGSIRADVSIRHFEVLFRGLGLALQPYSPAYRELMHECGLIILKGMRA
ncbi:TetR/AcrR family transcriptional regulator [Pseudarthrobacter scleromae]|uniref:TetR/AcrR family transcriptional regulator n=1 Tax=Pseudarthrobacter scleromae TaxID=158897 RepID=UPI00363198DA